MDNYGESYYYLGEEEVRFQTVKMTNFILEKFKPKNVLDVGCGMGFLVKWLGVKGIFACGCDKSKYAIKHMSDPKYLTTNKLNISPFVQEADIVSLPYEDKSFDLVTCLNVLEHIPTDSVPLGVQEIIRVTSQYIFIKVTTHNLSDHFQLLPPGSMGDKTHLTIAGDQFWLQRFLMNPSLSRLKELENRAKKELSPSINHSIFIFKRS